MACSEQDVRRGALMIRTRDGESVGDVPLDPCGNFWSSPDLWVDGGPDRTTAREGATMRIFARVTNGGDKPFEDINVEAWVCDYTAGPLPTGQLDPPSRVTGFAPGPLNPGQSAVIECAPTWVPTAAQVRINNGHLCLAANTWADTPPDGAELPAARAILPCCNTHHAQRNIALVAARSGMRIKQLMRLSGFEKGKEQRVLIEFRPVTDRRAFGAGELDLLRSSRYGRRLKRWQLGNPKEAKIELVGENVEGTRGELVLRPGKPREVTMDVGVPGGLQPGTILLFDTVTREPRTRDLLGGARLMVLVV